MKTLTSKAKKVFAFLLSLILLLSLFGCSKDNRDDTLTLEEYLTQDELKDRISIKFDPDDVKDFSDANVYEAEYWIFDENNVKSVLLHYPQTSEMADEAFSSYTTEEGDAEETLYFYAQDNIKNNFEYTHHFRQNFDIENYYFLYPEETTNGFGVSANNLIANPKKWKDLDFMPYQSVMKEVEKVFDALDFPEYRCQEVKALDLQSLTQVYRYFEELNMNDPTSTVPVQPIKENETYVLQYRQIIDDIPVMNYRSYQDPEKLCRRSIISVGYTEEGISDLYVNGLLKVGEGENQKIISSAKAASILADYFKTDPYTRDYRLESFELVYQAFLDKSNGKLTLAPFWFIRASEPFTEELEVPIEFGSSLHVLSYRYFFVNAVTGEFSIDYPVL